MHNKVVTYSKREAEYLMERGYATWISKDKIVSKPYIRSLLLTERYDVSEDMLFDFLKEVNKDNK